MAMIASPLQSAALAAALQPPPPVLAAAATIHHLEAAVCYNSQVQDYVFRHVATTADFSAALLYQNDVAMAQSPLFNQGFAVALPVFANLLAPIQASLQGVQAGLQAAQQALQAGQQALQAGQQALQQALQAGLQAVRDEQAVLRVSINNTRARAVNGRLPPFATLSVIRKEIAGHPAGVLGGAGLFANGAEPPVGLIPISKLAIRAITQHATLDQAYWFYNDPILANAAQSVSERRNILEEFLGECYS